MMLETLENVYILPKTYCAVSVHHYSFCLKQDFNLWNKNLLGQYIISGLPK